MAEEKPVQSQSRQGGSDEKSRQGGTEEKHTPPPRTVEADDNLRNEVRDLRNALAALRATVPTSLIPIHGAGEGDEIAETWSQAEQEESWNVENNWPGHRPGLRGSVNP